MPNYGGPNASCSECIRRKVKCDQTYPACLRCIKRNTICPGVKDQAAQIWRHETSKTISRAETHRPHAESSKVGSKDEAAAAYPPPNQFSAHQERDPQLNRPDESAAVLSPNIHKQVEHYKSVPESLGAPEEDVLVAFFFDQIACLDVGWYAYLPGLYHQAARDGYLNASIQSASLFVLANQRQDHLNLLVQARQSYSKALTALNAAISDQTERLLDDVLCTILIFSIIEDITGNSDSYHNAHLCGLQRLLRLRKSLGIKNLLGAEVWNAVAMRSQSLTIRTGRIDRLSSEILLPQMLSSPALLTHRTCGAICEFIDRVNKFINNAESSLNQDISLADLLKEGERLDLALQFWCNEEFAQLLEFRWKRYVAQVLLDAHSSSSLEYFASVQTAEMWNENRCARIYLHQAIQALVKHILEDEYMLASYEWRHDLGIIGARSGQAIDNMVDNICNSIPFNMHRIDSAGKMSTDQSQRVAGGTSLLRPLEVVLGCPRSSMTQKAWARDALFEIGHFIGVKKALIILGEQTPQVF